MSTTTASETVTDESEKASSFTEDLVKTFLTNAAAAAGLWGGMALTAFGAKKLLDRRAAKEQSQTETPPTES